MDVEGAHGDEHGEQLAEPAKALEEGRADRRQRRVQHAEPLPRHREQAPDPPELVDDRSAMPPRARKPEGKQGKPDAEHDLQARVGPVRHLRGEERVGDQQERWNQVEQPVGEHGSDQGGPGAVPSGQLAG